MENTNIVDDKVKNLIIKILSEEWPLTAKKIYYKIKKKGKSVTYQAVFKSLQYLVEKKIIEKKEYNYSLNKDWLTEKTDFYQDVKKRYFGEDKNFSSLILKNKSVTFKFSNFYKFLFAFADTAKKLNFLSKKDNYVAFAEFNQLPWPFAAGIKEEKLIRDFFRSYNRFDLLCKNENIANKLVYKYYKTLNKKIRLKFDKNCAGDCDILSMGNHVINFFYKKDFEKSMDRAYAKLKNLNQISLNELYKNLFLRETEITVVITRNPELARIKKEKIKLAFGLKS